MTTTRIVSARASASRFAMRNEYDAPYMPATPTFIKPASIFIRSTRIRSTPSGKSGIRVLHQR